SGRSDRSSSSLHRLPVARPLAAKNRIENMHLLDGVLDTVFEPPMPEYGKSKVLGLGRVLVDLGQDLAAVQGAVRAVADHERRLLVGWRVERDDDLDAAFWADRLDRLPARTLRAADEAQLPSVAEVGNDAGEAVGAEIGIAVDQCDDALRLGLEQIAA